MLICPRALSPAKKSTDTEKFCYQLCEMFIIRPGWWNCFKCWAVTNKQRHFFKVVLCVEEMSADFKLVIDRPLCSVCKIVRQENIRTSDFKPDAQKAPLMQMLWPVKLTELLYMCYSPSSVFPVLFWWPLSQLRSQILSSPPAPSMSVCPALCFTCVSLSLSVIVFKGFSLGPPLLFVVSLSLLAPGSCVCRAPPCWLVILLSYFLLSP